MDATSDMTTIRATIGDATGGPRWDVSRVASLPPAIPIRRFFLSLFLRLGWHPAVAGLCEAGGTKTGLTEAGYNRNTETETALREWQAGRLPHVVRRRPAASPGSWSSSTMKTAFVPVEE